MIAFSLGAVALAGGLLSGCSGGEPAKSTESEGGAKKEKEPVELVFFSNNGDSEESFNIRFGDAIRQKFPAYTIKYIQRVAGSTEIQHLIASNTRFDLYFDSIGNFESRMFDNGLQTDMTELIQTHGIDLSRFEPTIIDAMRQISDGKLHGLPVFNNNTILYYNKALFDKFGVPYPKDDMTWDEMNELSRKLNRSEDGKQYYGFAASSGHILRMNQLSIPNVDVATDTPTINKDERWKQFFNTVFVNPAQDPGYQASGKIPPLNAFIKDQTLAMYAYLSSLFFVSPTEMKALDWDMAALPTFKELPGVGSQAYPSYFGITKFATNTDAAMEVLRFLTSDEFQTDLAKKGMMPVLKSETVKKALGQDSPFKDKNLQAIYYNKFAPIAPRAKYDVLLINNYYTLADPLAMGKTDMNSAFRQAEEQAMKDIADYKNKIAR